jgi:predicted 2-oxoglutarate/Fe(II)-dependent dioxygenase YbiX
MHNSPLSEFSRGGESAAPTGARPKIILNSSLEAAHQIESELTRAKGTLEDFYGLKLGEPISPYVVVYSKGEGTGRHADNRGTVDRIKAAGGGSGDPRQVSIVIFLNDEDEKPKENTYSGGKLTFYGLVENEAFADFGFPVRGEAGKMVAFRSTVVHEVTTVTRGTRYVINTGFF